MSRYLLFVVTCLFLVPAQATRGAGRDKREETEQRTDALAALITVKTENGRGSGFICDMGETNDYIITNAHVIEAAKSIKLTTVEGRQFRPKSIELANNRDLARMRIPDTDVPSLKLAAHAPKIGAKIFAYGDSMGMDSITRLPGKVKGVGPQVLEISAEFVAGNSGGPILDNKGEVLGVATFVVKPKKVDWHVKDTEFEKPRRFGVRVNDRVQWVPVRYRQFYREASALQDVKFYLEDMGRISMILRQEDPRDTRSGFQKILLSKESLKSKRYADPAYATHLLTISNSYIQFYNSARKYSFSSYSVKGPLDRFYEALKRTPTLPRQKLQRRRWSTNHYKKQADEYIEMFETWEKDIEPLKSQRAF